MQTRRRLASLLRYFRIWNRSGPGLDRSALRFLWSFVRPYRARVGVALLWMGLATLFDLALPYLLKVALDDYILPGNWQAGLWILPVYFGALLGLSLVHYIQTYWMDLTAQYIMRDLRNRLFAHLVHLPMPFFHQRPAGQLVTRVTNDIEAMQDLLGQGLVAIIADLVVSISIFGVLLWLSPLLALMVLGATPLVILISFVFRHWAQQAQDWIRSCLSRLNALIQEHISGITTLRLYAAEPESFRAMEHASHEYTRANIDAVVHYAWYYPAIRSVEVLTSVLTLVVGGILFARGQVTLGIIVAFLQYIQRFFEPIADLSDKYNIFLQASVAAQRVHQILQQPTDPAYRGAAFSLDRPPEVRFRELSFRYASHLPWVLKNISLTIRAAQRWAIGGVTGAGKSTLMYLLLRFYPISTGSIHIAGQPIDRVSATDLRRHIGIAFQEPFLFSTTVEENILLGRDGACAQTLAQLLEAWRGNALIERLRGKLHRNVAERGANLSQSEKQAIALLRALVHRPLLLILDEAMSALDVESEHHLHALIERAMERRTVILIAHRLNALPPVDQVVLLHQGQIIEQGHPEELIQRGDSIFASLVRLHRYA